MMTYTSKIFLDTDYERGLEGSADWKQVVQKPCGAQVSAL
jgi:hypothetical protein